MNESFVAICEPDLTGSLKRISLFMNQTPHLRLGARDVLSGAGGAATDSGPPGQHFHSGPPAVGGGFECRC